MDNGTLLRRYPYSGNGPRRYMSKAQRACDLCRSRKSACQIDTAPPCRLCRVHGQHCEFTDRIVRRKRRPLQTTPRPSLNILNDGNASNDGRTNESSEFASLVQPTDSIAMHMTEGAMHGNSPRVVEQLYDLSVVQGLEDSHASVLGSGDHGIMDELMLSIYEGQGLSHIEPSPALGPPSLDNHPSLSSQLCGLTGDMDPYVLRHYRFDARAEFPFSKLAIRSVQDTEMPVQFLLSKPELSNESKAPNNLETPFAKDALPELSQIVAPEIGERLIQL